MGTILLVALVVSANVTVHLWFADAPLREASSRRAN